MLRPTLRSKHTRMQMGKGDECSGCLKVLSPEGGNDSSSPVPPQKYPARNPSKCVGAGKDLPASSFGVVQGSVCTGGL